MRQQAKECGGGGDLPSGPGLGEGRPLLRGRGGAGGTQPGSPCGGPSKGPGRAGQGGSSLACGVGNRDFSAS